MCLYPKLIKNRKYLPNKKNKGTPPVPKDERATLVAIGCGKCMECMRQKARNWSVRLQEEIRNTRGGKFVTLSFTEEELQKLDDEIDERLKGYDRDNEIATLAVRRFLGRWRKKYGKSVRHWLVTELGDQYAERLHIHGILWIDNDILMCSDEVASSLRSRGETPHPQYAATNAAAYIIGDRWQYGNVWIGEYVNERTINYIVKYLHKQDIKHKYYKPVILCSKGIGSNYMNRTDSNNNRYKGKKTNDRYITRSGIKLPLPMYYRNKIYNDDEREELWMNLLDKQIRYVNGIEVDISANEEVYYKILKDARIRNSELGYGDDSKDWDRIKYERERRNIQKWIRINKLKNKGDPA